MSLSLDHVFIITEPGAAVADLLLEFGMVEGNANVHPGQGTANRRFFLDGFMLELLFVNDAAEAENGAGRRIGLLQRSLTRQASPYGLVTRMNEPEVKPEFPNWQYVPDYFDGSLCFHIGANSDLLLEPLCICMPPLLSRATVPCEFANPGWRLTGLDLAVPVANPSETLEHFSAIDLVNVTLGKPHAMTLTFNHGMAGRLESLVPNLPLTLKW